MARLLALTLLADETVDDYDLVRFEGREALSEPFLYRLEVVAHEAPATLSSWIGKPVEFTVTWRDGTARPFAGRIYEARLQASPTGLPTVALVVRPAYWAAHYARGTHFIQDKSSLDIFDAVTADVPGLTVDKTASGATTRPYAVRYDESELDFLDRLLAQDGFFYFFTYDKSAGAYRHKMKLASAVSAYLDVPDDVALAFHSADGGGADMLAGQYKAVAGTRRFHAFEVNALDEPRRDAVTVSKSWGAVYAHGHETLSGVAASTAQSGARGTAHTDAVEQDMESFAGSSREPALFAGGKLPLTWSEGAAPRKVVLTSVEHSAYDPSGLGGSGAASYANRFTAIAATLAFRPPAPLERRRAHGPVLGVVKSDSGADGQVVVDAKSRIPVAISMALEGDSAKPFPTFVWLPVQQQWAHGTHGSQFFPRIGTRVIVDFLYGDPDLPFVAGTIYTPSAKYPFDPASKATQTGWQSKTDKNGSITQQFMFEDKPGSEEIYLYTGRDYRRQVDHDETGTVKNDRTITVEHDHMETVKNDQTVKVDNNQDETIGKDQTITVQQNRTMKVTGKQDTTIQQTRTVTVTGKSALESKQEIDLTVGPSSIKITMQGIEIKAPMITIKADATLDMSGGAQAQLKAPLVQVNADATLILKGGLVLIN